MEWYKIECVEFPFSVKNLIFSRNYSANPFNDVLLKEI